MERETVPHVGSHNAKQPPVAHHQERADCEICIGIQQTAAIRHTITNNIGIQQTSVVASMDDH